MFTNLFGPPPTEQPPTEKFSSIDVTTRRTEAEVYKLVRTFQVVLNDSPHLRERIEYFWPSAEFSDRVLFAIAHDIPKASNPLWPADTNEIFPNDQRVQENEEDSDGSSDEGLEKQRRHRRKKRPVSVEPKCVEWLGLVNSQNGFAAIKLTMPATFDDWVTWTNRLLVFLFADIPHYAVPEDFINVLNPPEGGPFRMRCQNPKCVRLSHIDYLPSHYGVSMFDAAEHQQISTPLEENSAQERDSYRGRGSREPMGSTMFQRSSLTKLPSMYATEEKERKKNQRFDDEDDEETEQMMTEHHLTNKAVWSPGFG